MTILDPIVDWRQGCVRVYAAPGKFLGEFALAEYRAGWRRLGRRTEKQPTGRSPEADCQTCASWPVADPTPCRSERLVRRVQPQRVHRESERGAEFRPESLFHLNSRNWLNDEPILRHKL